MSHALCCDNCGTTLPLNARGDHEGGEDAAWLRLTIGTETVDLCTRSCLAAFIEREEVIKAHESYAEAITGVARTINEARDDEDDGEDQP